MLFGFCNRCVVRLFLQGGGNLAHNVLVGVVEPLIEGDGAVIVGVNSGEVLLPLGKTGLQ